MHDKNDNRAPHCYQTTKRWGGSSGRMHVKRYFSKPDICLVSVFPPWISIVDLVVGYRIFFSCPIFSTCTPDTTAETNSTLFPTACAPRNAVTSSRNWVPGSELAVTADFEELVTGKYGKSAITVEYGCSGKIRGWETGIPGVHGIREKPTSNTKSTTTTTTTATCRTLGIVFPMGFHQRWAFFPTGDSGTQYRYGTFHVTCG